MTHTDLIMMYGFSEDEVRRAETVLPNKKAEAVNIECFTDILATRSYAILINLSNTAKSDLMRFSSFIRRLAIFLKY